MILFYISHLELSILLKQPSSKAIPLFGPPTVTKFLIGNLVSQLSTIYLPISEPWDRPKMLIYLLPKMGCSLIFLQASSDWLIRVVKIEETSPFPTSTHSTWPLVPVFTCATKFFNKSSLQFYFIPWNMTVGVDWSKLGPSLGLEVYYINDGFLDFFLFSYWTNREAIMFPVYVAAAYSLRKWWWPAWGLIASSTTGIASELLRSAMRTNVFIFINIIN